MTAVAERPSVGFALGNHEERIRALEFSPGGSGGSCGDWIYVGTVGLDGVDSLLTAESPPFTPPWTNALGINAPVSFMTDGCFVYLRGSPGVGVVGTEIFIFPVGFRPIYQQPLIAMPGDGTLGGEADCIVYPTGSLKYVRAES